MNELPYKRLLFIDEMLHNKEAADYGFESLTKRSIFDAQMFQAIRAKGLLKATENPGPTAAKAEGYVHIPYWPALDYLEGIAHHSLTKGDVKLGQAVAETIIDISTAKDDPRGPQDNYHTWRKFTVIISKLPSEAITDILVSQVNSWMSSQYDRSMVVSAIGEALLPRLLKEENARHIDQALMLFDYATSIRWIPDDATDPEQQEPEFAADPYWLKSLLQDNMPNANQRLGIKLIKLFRQRLREIYSRGTREKASWVARPAIEEHEQNHSWDDINNLLVDALRDSLINTIDPDIGPQRRELMEMYASDTLIERRIAIHVFDIKFSQIHDHIIDVLDERLLHKDCLHEAYWFLKRHFSTLPNNTKEKLFAAIAQLAPEQPDPEREEDAGLWMQLRWLHAIDGQGFEPANTRLSTLVANPKIKAVPDNPDFYSYHYSQSGPGPSKYSVDELLVFLDDGSLVSKVNTFVPTANWPFGYTRRALSDTLEMAIKQHAIKFFSKIDLLLEMERPYQYAFISAFKSLWNAEPQEKTGLNWDQVWPKLINLIERLMTDDFWSEKVIDDESMTPDRDWIPPLIVELIKDGTRNDTHAFSADLLPAARKILTTILNNLTYTEETPSNDPMHYAINSSRGRAIDAFFSFSLRAMRIADRDKKNRSIVWDELEPVFAKELQNTNGHNFEFSTLAASYWAHLTYLNPEWFEHNRKEILCPTNEENFKCAMGGLAFAHANKELYKHLRDTGAVERATASIYLPEKSHDQIIEKITLAYLWELEPLESSVIQSLFSEHRESDLDTALKFLWSIHKQELSAKQVKLILDFWRKATRFVLESNIKSTNLLSRLAVLICYITQLDDTDEKLILSLAPYANENHTSYYFVEQLERLLDNYPRQVVQFALAYLKANGEVYDFESQWLRIATKLSEKNLRPEVTEIAEIMRKRPGFDELYRKIKEDQAGS